ncbi:MAG: His-Xaa-Ser system protein HxsD [Mangrovibacterium sp.]
MKTHLKIKVDSVLYGEDVIYKAAYELSGKYAFRISLAGKSYEIEVSKKDNSIFMQQEKEEMKKIFHQALIDFKTRSIILSETKNVRDLIIMKAFFHFSDEPIDYEDVLKS